MSAAGETPIAIIGFGEVGTLPTRGLHAIGGYLSCKGRGVCPSCNALRMAEVAAHLVDEVFPVLPVRQWVLAVPKRLRYFDAT